jgi:hypothetical protein
MKTDRRKSPRRAISRRAKIEIAGGSRDCLVTDMSDGGVRIFAEGGNVPDRFVLWFSDGDDSTRPRACRVIWRLGPELGAEFTDTPDDKARSAAPAREPAAV